MSTLSNKNIDILTSRGITIKNDRHYGSSIDFTTTGMAWLFNYLNFIGPYGSKISFALLKSIANFKPKSNYWRELRIKSSQIPVYEDDIYLQITLYLNGSPPVAVHSFPPNIKSISEVMSIPLVNGGVFGIRNDLTVNLVLDKSEVSLLQSKGIISTKPIV